MKGVRAFLQPEDSYLDFRNNGAFLRTGACKCCQRGWGDNGVGAGEVAEITAWNLILFVPHDNGFHYKKAIPRQPQCVFLSDERSPLKVEDNGDPADSDKIKAVF